jgi:hypothetical protein
MLLLVEKMKLIKRNVYILDSVDGFFFKESYLEECEDEEQRHVANLK